MSQSSERLKVRAQQSAPLGRWAVKAQQFGVARLKLDKLVSGTHPPLSVPAGAPALVLIDDMKQVRAEDVAAGDTSPGLLVNSGRVSHLGFHLHLVRQVA